MKVNQAFPIAACAFLSLSWQSLAQTTVPAAFTNVELSGSIIGSIVIDPRDEQVGKIAELAVDWQAGRVAAVLVDTGGYLTTDKRIVAVPPECFTLAGNARKAHMTADVDAFDNAPAFDMVEWSESADPAKIIDVYERFHITPYGAVENVEPTRKIIGLTARNERNEKLAKLDSLVVELPGGRIPQVIISSIGFFGRKGDLTAVAPQAFLFEPEYGAIILDTTKEALKNAPHFRTDDWRTGVTKAMNSSAVSDSLGVLHSLNNLESNAESDQATSLEIQRRIMAADDLSMDARLIEVVTHNGRVTLRGTVPSEREKQRIGEIAAAVVPAALVTNNITVKLYAESTVSQ